MFIERRNSISNQVPLFCESPSANCCYLVLLLFATVTYAITVVIRPS